MKPRKVFVAGTDTDIGKTVLAGLLALAWRARYWKPVQSGLEPPTDSQRVAEWIGADRVFPERWRLTHPLSPNQSAELDGVLVRLADFELPRCDEPLVVEGAGGLMVPLNERDMIIDLIAHLQLPTVLAARAGLGTLNHTLLSVEALNRRGVPLLGVVLIGEGRAENRRDIERFGRVPVIGAIPRLEKVDAPSLARVYADFFDDF